MEDLIDLFLGNGLKPLLYDKELAEIEKSITRSELIALILLKRKQTVTMSEWAADLGTPLSTATNIGQRLAGRGYIERRRDERDGRVIVVSLTSEGRKLADHVTSLFTQLLGKVEEALTPQELQQFIQLSIKVAKALQKTDDDSYNDHRSVDQLRNIPID